MNIGAIPRMCLKRFDLKSKIQLCQSPEKNDDDVVLDSPRQCWETVNTIQIVLTKLSCDRFFCVLSWLIYTTWKLKEIKIQTKFMHREVFLWKSICGADSRVLRFMDSFCFEPNDNSNNFSFGVRAVCMVSQY